MERVAIITGGTSGIGKSIAEKFVANSYKVVVVARDKLKLKSLKEQLKDNCDIYSVDVSSETEVAGLFKDITAKYGKIDVLVNSAGFFKSVGTQIVINESVNNWNSVIATNLTGSFLMSIYVAPLLKRPGGRIVNISSIAAFTGGSAGGGLAYSASKAGINGLTFGLARELSKDGITVNSIAPGFIENTEFTSVYSKESKEKIIGSVPSGRSGTVTDISELCYFLCSPQASFITGEIINANGGWLFGR